MSKELIQIPHNIGAAQKYLERLARKVGTVEPALKGIGESLLISTENRFDTQTGPDGQKWKDVKPSTRKRKKHSKVLTEQGHLRGDVHYQVSDNQLLLGVGIAYGAIHQLGGEIKQEGVTLHLKGTGRNTRFAKKGEGTRTKTVNRKIKMPARPYLGISRQDEADILDEVMLHLKS